MTRYHVYLIALCVTFGIIYLFAVDSWLVSTRHLSDDSFVAWFWRAFVPLAWLASLVSALTLLARWSP